LRNVTSVVELPSVPAVYAMFGGQGRNLYVAYVGLASNLRQRLTQHLIRRDSSVVTGVSAVSLNPDLITDVRWWEHPDFARQEILEAAELVAFDVLEPALRSRGGITDRAIQIYQDEVFREQMRILLVGDPAGSLVLPTLSQALERISSLERRVTELESAMALSRKERS
jgi:hypothetical protein